MKLFASTLMVIATVVAMPVQAQDNTGWDKIVLENATGSVMTSTGGEYQSAAAGKTLAIGENMMVAGSSSAKVVYYDLDEQGKIVRTCSRDYTQANTYLIDANCTAVAGRSGTGVAQGGAWIAGAAVLAAVVINGGNSVDAGSISAGPRR